MSALGSLITLSLLLTDATQTTDAAPSFEACDALRREQPEDRAGYACYYVTAKSAGQLDDARVRLEELLDADPTRAWARATLANVLVDLGDRDRATRLQREAVAALVDSADVGAKDKAVLELNFASTLRDQWLREEAIGHFQRAEQFAEQASVPPLVAMAQLERANMYRLLGTERAQIRALVEHALPVVMASGKYVLEAKALIIAANVAEDAGDLAAAIGYREQMAAIADEADDAYMAASARAVMALMRARRFDHRVAGADPAPLREEARAAVEAAEQAQHIHAAAVARCALGILQPEPALAVPHLRGCLEGEQTASFTTGVRYARSLLAGRLAKLGPEHHAEAARLSRSNVEEAESAGSREDLFRARVDHALVLWDIGDSARAHESARRGLDDLELFRDLDDDAIDRVQTLHRYGFAYHILSGKLLGLPDRTRDDVEQAFAAMERLRARTLMERLVSARGSAYSADGPHARAREAVLHQLATVQRRLLADTTPREVRAGLLQRVAELEARERRLRTEVARRDPTFAAMRTPDVPRLSDVSRSLSNDEAILAFQLADTLDRDQQAEGGSWVLVITSARTSVHRLPDRHRLQRQIPMLSGLVSKRDGSEREALARLHRDLLADALGGLPDAVDRLVIVPDGILYDVPFGALRDAIDSRPLAARFEISVSPSVTSLLRWRESEARAGGTLLALAHGGSGAELPGPAVRGGVFDADVALAPLPRAATEARSVAARFGRSQVRTGAAASESFLKSTALDAFGVLHFATHAIVDEEHPERSGIALEAGAPTEDGLLQAREIVDLPLEGKVVVLSACSGLAGTVMRGEGLMSLTRSFLLAGAHAVVASRWPITDADAELLFERLYRHIGRGHSLSAALAMAKRDLIDAGAPPAAWAGVVIVGDGDIELREPTLAQRLEDRWVSLLLGSALLSLGLGMAWRRKRAVG